jgi:hypothetical protein
MVDWDREAVLADAEGRFLLERLIEREYSVRALSPDGGSTTVKVRPPVDDVTIVVPRTGALAVTVIGVSSRWEIDVLSADRNGVHAQTTFDVSGQGLMEALMPGKYVVRAKGDGEVVEASAVVLAGEETVVVLEARAGATIRGKVTYYPSGRAASDLKCFAAGAFGDVNDEGEFVLRDVPSGEVTVSCNSYDYTQGLRMIDAEADVRAEPAAEADVEVFAVDLGKPSLDETSRGLGNQSRRCPRQRGRGAGNRSAGSCGGGVPNTRPTAGGAPGSPARRREHVDHAGVGVALLANDGCDRV